MQFNDAEILQDKGKVTAAIAKEFAESKLEKYISDFDRISGEIEW